MDPAACRVIYIDDRFNTERWISRDGLGPVPRNQRKMSTADFEDLPEDLQANVNAFLSVFNQGMFAVTFLLVEPSTDSDQFTSVAPAEPSPANWQSFTMPFAPIVFLSSPALMLVHKRSMR